MILYKNLKKLYQGKYQYKIVLVFRGAHCFRGNDPLRVLNQINYYTSHLDPNFRAVNQRELLYLHNLYICLQTLTNYTVRVENPFLSIYSTNEYDIDAIKNICIDNVKEIYNLPIPTAEGEVISTLPYDYKVHVRILKNIEYSGFLSWATDNKNIRIPKSTVNDMTSNYPYQPRYFYVSGDKNLTMAKMYLTSITKVEKIVNP